MINKQWNNTPVISIPSSPLQPTASKNMKWASEKNKVLKMNKK